MKRLALLLPIAIACAAHAAAPYIATDGEDRLVTDASGNAIYLRWNLDAMPTPGAVPWDMAAMGDPTGTLSIEAIEQTFRAAFQAWEDVDTASLAFVANNVRCANNDARGDSLGVGFDGDNLLTFTDPDNDTIFQPGTIALSTVFYLTEPTVIDVPDATGEFVDLGGLDGVPDLRRGTYEVGFILDGDVAFNPAYDFVIGTGPLSGNDIDLQSVATHEIGHMLGLTHSPIGALVGTDHANPATMNPFAHEDPVVIRSLALDDRVGVSMLYPAPSFASLGTIAGSVRRGEAPVVSAIVTALPLVAEQTTFADGVSVFTDTKGDFAIPGLAAGDYVVSVQPLTDWSGTLWTDRYNTYGGLANDLDFPQEYFGGAAESAVDAPSDFAVITLTADDTGQVSSQSGVSIQVNDFDTIVDRDEINDTLSQAMPIEVGMRGGIHARLSVAGDRDFYRFEAEKDDALVIDARAHYFNLDLDLALKLHDETGALVAYNDNALFSSAGFLYVETYDPRIEIENLPATGTYFLEVYAPGNDQAGPYLLTVHARPTLLRPVADADGNGLVDARDASAWFGRGARTDITADGRADYRDVFRLLFEWRKR